MNAFISLYVCHIMNEIILIKLFKAFLGIQRVKLLPKDQ